MISSLGSAKSRIWPFALVLASLAFSTMFYCVAPLAAIAVFAARTLQRGPAIVTVILAVAVSQAAGFLVLGYPWTLSAMLWAPVFAVATLAAWFVASRLPNIVAGSVAAFVAFEAVLAAYTIVMEHSLAAFSPAVTGEVASINLAGAAVLFVVYLALGAAERAAGRSDAGTVG